MQKQYYTKNTFEIIHERQYNQYFSNKNAEFHRACTWKTPLRTSMYMGNPLKKGLRAEIYIYVHISLFDFIIYNIYIN